MTHANLLRLFFGLVLAVAIAVLVPPVWAACGGACMDDSGTCGAIDPSCPCGVGHYESIKFLYCYGYPNYSCAYRRCSWDCEIPYPGADPAPMNVYCREPQPPRD